MGVFDYVRCEYPLPDSQAQDLVFQTKDTDAMYLETYKITEAGRLLHYTGEYETVPLEERHNYGKPGFEKEGSFLRFAGSMRMKDPQWIDTNFHGALNFYADDFDYTALFKDGQLIDLRKEYTNAN